MDRSDSAGQPYGRKIEDAPGFNDLAIIESQTIDFESAEELLDPPAQAKSWTMPSASAAQVTARVVSRRHNKGVLPGGALTSRASTK